MIHFKRLEKNHINIISALMVDFYAIDNYPITIEKSKVLLDQFIENPALGLAWLIHKNETVVGYLILTFVFSFEYQGKIAFLDELYVQPQAQGQGIGKSAVAFAKTQSEELGLKLLYLEVEEHNLSAQQLYLKNGFTFHPRKLMKLKL
jgi:ribosomal protein S18 acetylase RimI-like enzyme|nr:GNAT family N-acetyltransferase [uncultured Flavobacterium sp.]